MSNCNVKRRYKNRSQLNRKRNWWDIKGPWIQIVYSDLSWTPIVLSAGVKPLESAITAMFVTVAKSKSITVRLQIPKKDFLRNFFLPDFKVSFRIWMIDHNSLLPFKKRAMNSEQNWISDISQLFLLHFKTRFLFSPGLFRSPDLTDANLIRRWAQAERGGWSRFVLSAFLETGFISVNGNGGPQPIRMRIWKEQ